MTTNDLDFINIGVVCEGQTETDFIKQLNKNYFNKINISLKPVGINDEQKNIGGNISIARVVDFLHKHSNMHPRLTTFIDFYRLKNKGNKKVSELEEEIKNEFYKDNKYRNKMLIPYIQMHETEALWFSDINAIIQVKNANEQQQEGLSRIIEKYKNPEDINDSYETAPSKRLENIFGNYSKVIDGKEISNKISINIFIEKCPRFSKWVNEISNLQKNKRFINSDNRQTY